MCTSIVLSSSCPVKINGVCMEQDENGKVIVPQGGINAGGATITSNPGFFGSIANFFKNLFG